MYWKTHFDYLEQVAHFVFQVHLNNETIKKDGGGVYIFIVNNTPEVAVIVPTMQHGS